MRRVSILTAAIAALCCAAEQPRPQADRIVIAKSAHTMKLLRGNQVIREYKIALGGQPVGPKERQGHKTPEGDYKIDWKQEQSRFHLALHVSYPNSGDRARARERGANPGGSIMIHGLEKKYSYLGALHRQFDWTDGCIAVTNAEIEEIWKLVPVGTRVEIRP